MDVIEELKTANEDLKRHNLHAEIFVVGGAALNLLNISFRETFDIDCFIKSSHLSLIKEIFSNHRINDNVKFIAFVPDQNDYTIANTINLSNLTAHVASLEDVALMKLFSNRPKDYDDLTKFILPLVTNKDQLVKRCLSYESSYVGQIEFTNWFALKNQLM